MFVVIVNMRVEPDRLDDFRAALAENAEATRREPGCLRFDVLQSTDDPCAFVLHEIYRDEHAFFGEHRSARHYPSWKAASAACVVPGTHQNTYCVPAELPATGNPDQGRTR